MEPEPTNHDYAGHRGGGFGNCRFGNGGDPALHAPPPSKSRAARDHRRGRRRWLDHRGTVVRAGQPTTRSPTLRAFVLAIITMLFVTFQMQRLASQHGHRLLVPAAVVMALVASAVFFRIDGFSGELVPQLKYRFAQPPPEIRSVSAESPAVVMIDEATTGEATAAADFLGFLGNERNAVIGERMFSLPTDPSQAKVLWNQGSATGWSSFSVAGDRAVTLEQRDETGVRHVLPIVRWPSLVDGQSRGSARAPVGRQRTSQHTDDRRRSRLRPGCHRPRVVPQFGQRRAPLDRGSARGRGLGPGGFGSGDFVGSVRITTGRRRTVRRAFRRTRSQRGDGSQFDCLGCGNGERCVGRRARTRSATLRRG